MFHAGQHVVCVKEGTWSNDAALSVGDWGPRKGCVYVVSSVSWHFPDVVLTLDGWETDPFGERPQFLADRFRPLQDSRLDIFRQILVNPPKQGVDA